MRTYIATITPEVATQMLGRNINNIRSIRRHIVSYYAELMRRGEWDLTHQGICFDEQGVLVDGQHRLRAVVASGCTVQMMVTEGMAAAGWSVDNGLARQMHEMIGKNNLVVQACNAIYRFAMRDTRKMIPSETALMVDAIGGIVSRYTRGQYLRGRTTAVVRGGFAIAEIHHKRSVLGDYFDIVSGNHVGLMARLAKFIDENASKYDTMKNSVIAHIAYAMDEKNQTNTSFPSKTAFWEEYEDQVRNSVLEVLTTPKARKAYAQIHDAAMEEVRVRA